MKINEVATPDIHRSIAANHGLLLSPDVKKFLAFCETVKSDCAPYIKEISGDVSGTQLHRGVIGTKKPYIAKRVRLEDRKPKDTSPEVHDAINQYFTKKFGAPFRNAIFATSDVDQAGEYAFGGYRTGEIYTIFPVGKFKYIWSPQIPDLLDSIYEYDLPGTTAGGEWKRFADERLSTYQSTDLKSAINSSHEVMIRCEEYYGIKYTDEIDYKYWQAFEELVKS